MGRTRGIMSDQAVAFMSITNADMATAQSYLDMCNGDVDAAVCTFFAQESAPAPVAPSMPTVLGGANAMLGGGEKMSEEDRAMQEALAMSMADAGAQPTSDEELVRRGLLASSVEGNSFAALGDPEPMNTEPELSEEQQALNEALQMSMDKEPEQDEAMQQAVDMPMQQDAPAAGGAEANVRQFQEMCGNDDAEMARNYLDAFNGDLNAAVEMFMQSNGHGSSAAGPSAENAIGAGFATMYNDQYGLLHPQFCLDDYD